MPNLKTFVLVLSLQSLWSEKINKISFAEHYDPDLSSTTTFFWVVFDSRNVFIHPKANLIFSTIFLTPTNSFVHVFGQSKFLYLNKELIETLDLKTRGCGFDPKVE